MVAVWTAIGQQLKNPQGMAGRITGRAMTILNAVPNKLAIEALDIQSDDRILELGFGPGAAITLMLLHLSTGSISGIEQSDIMLDQALVRNRGAVSRGRLHLQKGDFGALPFADESFDKILAVNTVYFWRDDSVARECLRVLRSGGLLVVYATHEATMRHWKFADRETHRHFTASTLEALLKDGGFPQCDVHETLVSRFPAVRGLIAAARK